jgi:3-oxoacyl-[acyl-carrier protein] reductase
MTQNTTDTNPTDGAATPDTRKRVALVTGAGQGVGRQVALDLVATGVAEAVVVNDFVADRADAVAKEIEAIGGRAIGAAADVCDIDAVREVVARATRHFGGIDILVNNAGNSGTAGLGKDQTRFWESDPADWAPWIGVNFTGVLNCTREVLPGMVEAGYGRIVTVVSDAGRIGEPQLVVYSAAKAGAAGFTRAVAKSVGRHGITANCVSLGATETPTTGALSELDEATTRKLLSNYVIKRFGHPGDASAAITFLASEAAGWITTQTLPVNGGYSSAL